MKIKLSVLLAVIAVVGSGSWLYLKHSADVREREARRQEMAALVDTARNMSEFYVNGGTTDTPFEEKSLEFPKQFDDAWRRCDQTDVELQKMRAEFEVHIDTAAIAAQMSRHGPNRKWGDEMQKRLATVFSIP